MNLLSLETSPYLLQHANNPVNWLAWNDYSLEKAIVEDKPIILSIGYSACHWCHVMEHECFENEVIAEVMNQYFVCIKVDREERPDVDGIYMEAIQAMGIHGGWPLNVFLMPDTKPFYGGTYFPANKWVGLCKNIAEAFQNNRNELQKSADGFADNMDISEITKYGLQSSESLFQKTDFELIINRLASNFDPVWGGMNKAPKFPMPSIWQFVLGYCKFANGESKNPHDEGVAQIENQLQTTLNRMAMGGIFDQIGGGFSRYSVDGEWFCPHFEKMLYDNGQLLSLYAKAFQQFRNPLYKETIIQTIGWLKREMLTNEGSFYSAQDADSEGVEGKFYIWTQDEVEGVLKDEANSFCSDFQINFNGNWEHSQNILWKKEPFLNSKYQSEIDDLLNFRNRRIFPGLDDKILCSWNALIINGLLDSYKAIGDDSYLQLAVDCGGFIKHKLYRNGTLYRTYKNGESKIEGFLEDYSTVISAFICLYSSTFDESWLGLAESLMLTCLEDFYDEPEGFFNFSSAKSKKLIANKKELFDNVIPASNSMMAHNLYDLGVYTSRNDFIDLSNSMASAMKPLILRNPEYLSHWASIGLKLLVPKVEIVVFGPKFKEFCKGLEHFQFLNYFVFGTNGDTNLPIFLNRTPPENKTYIYVCVNNTCSLPVESIQEVEVILSGLRI